MRRFFAPPENIGGSLITLGPEETRHLRDVLRLKSNDEVSVFDGDGHEYKGHISEIKKKNSCVLIDHQVDPASPESPLDLSLAATVLNGEKYDLIVQKSVELGVRVLTPMITVHCDVKQKDAAKRVGRWQRIALEATKQCGRAQLMLVTEPINFGDVISNTSPEELVMFSERDGKPLPKFLKAKKITALTGPKGGWDDSELKLAVSLGVSVVTLGGRILRAETAAIAFASILQHRLGDLN
jgi:16S rRNA (uracil1498-N3)-methyltransferase